MKKNSIETGSQEETNKGYNEKNPAQPQGAFAPDAADEPIPHERVTKKRMGDASKKVKAAAQKKGQP